MFLPPIPVVQNQNNTYILHKSFINNTDGILKTQKNR